MATSSQVNDAFRKVYEAASALIRELCDPFLESFEELGLGKRGGRAFREGLEKVVGKLMFTPLDQEPLSQIHIEGGGDKRRVLLHELFVGLGVDKDTSGRYADSLASAARQYRPDGSRLPFDPSWRDITHWKVLLGRWFPVINARGRMTYGRLEDIKRDASRPYRGTASHPRAGVDQTVDLLKRFPDIAPHVLDSVGFTHVEAFPPDWKIGASREEKAFVEAFKAELDRDWWQGMLFTAGLAVIAITLTFLSAGTLSPAAAALVGVGIGTAQGGIMVFDAQQKVGEGKVATMIGAMEPETLRRLENELQGAWAMLAVDAATGGILAKFGGTRLASQIVRATVINGAGSGIGTAMNPNVWESPDRAAIIFQATLIGGTVGGGGAALGGAVSRALTRGGQVQIAIERNGGPLKVGRQVKVATGPNAEPMAGTVIAIDEAAGTMMIRAGRSQFQVKVDKSIAIAADVPAPRPSMQSRAIVHAPRTAQDTSPFAPIRSLEARSLQNSQYLRSLSPESLLGLSNRLMPEVQNRLSVLGYRTTPVRVPNESGSQHFALQIDHAPGRFGTVMRRAAPLVDDDLRYVYDPVGLTLDGGSGLYDDSIRAIRLGHSVMANAHEGVVSPIFHELRHSRTSRFVRLGNADYPYQGAFIFDEAVEPRNLHPIYRSSFQVDEVLTHQRQSVGSLRETNRAIGLVDRNGLAALEDPRVKTFFEQGPRIAGDESIQARGFARVVKRNATEMLEKVTANAHRATPYTPDGAPFPSTAYDFVDASGRKVLTIEYWSDANGTSNAVLVADSFDAAGNAVDEGKTILHFMMGEVPAGYRGDYSHRYITGRLMRMIAASDETIQRALLTERRVEAADDLRRVVFERVRE